jgi:transposase
VRITAGPFTLQGLSAELAERGIKTHPRAVWVFVHAERLSFKKTISGRGTDVARQRARWKPIRAEALLAAGVHRRDLGETNMAPLRGWE